MGKHGDSLLMTLGWIIGGFLFSLAVLFSLLGAFILGALLLPFLPLVAVVVAVVIVIVMIFRGEPAQQNMKESAIPTTHDIPVLATIVDAEGACPLRGWSFHKGDVLTLNGKWSGAEICPRAERMLSETAARVRRDEAQEGELCQCLGQGHTVVFQLRKAEREKVGALE
jgi:hypothetical protein